MANNNTLASIRAKLAEKEKRMNPGQSGGGDNTMYPFWNIPDGSTAKLRFLPDADPNNEYFWVEKILIHLPFNGVDNDLDKKTYVRVPCMEMYGKVDPIIAETKPWWKDKEMEDIARQYWKKRSYIYQGFVVDDPLNEENAPENPIRRFSINSSIYGNIKSGLMDDEVENYPVDYDSGYDFRLIKTKKGKYADYTTSKFSGKPRSLSDAELQAIEKYGLFNLSDYLPKEPSREEQKIIMEMFADSVDGNPYSTAKYGNFFKPVNSTYGVNSDADTEEDLKSTKTVSKPVVAKPVVEDEEDEKDEKPFSRNENTTSSLNSLRSKKTEEDSSETVSTKDPNEIVAMLRARGINRNT